MSHDLFASLPAADPYPLYHAQRERDPVHRAARGWIVTGHADALRVLREPAFGRQGFQAVVSAAFAAPEPDVGTSMLFLDPPDHTRLRGLVSRAFTPRAVERMRPRIDAMVRGLSAEWADGAVVDLVGDFAYPLAIQVICEMLGVPPADWRWFQRWSFDFARVLDNVGLAADAEVATRGTAARKALTAYFRDELIPERRRRPGADLLSALIAAEADADTLADTDTLTDAELLATCNFLIVAGHETTVGLLTSGLLSLLQRPDQCAALRGDPDLTASAVEELLRYESPIQIVSRVVRAGVELSGRHLAEGDMVFVVVGAANRDPARFPEPDRLDVTRDARDHLAFGWGIHFCLGAALARLEAEIALPSLLATFPRMGLAAPAGDWRRSITLRSLATLHVRLPRS